MNIRKLTTKWKCVEDGAMVAYSCWWGSGYTWFADGRRRNAVIVAHGRRWDYGLLNIVRRGLKT
jgi:hypothetical protein